MVEREYTARMVGYCKGVPPHGDLEQVTHTTATDGRVVVECGKLGLSGVDECGTGGEICIFKRSGLEVSREEEVPENTLSFKAKGGVVNLNVNTGELNIPTLKEPVRLSPAAQAFMEVVIDGGATYQPRAQVIDAMAERGVVVTDRSLMTIVSRLRTTMGKGYLDKASQRGYRMLPPTPPSPHRK